LWISTAADLALEFAIARCIDGSEGRARGSQGLRIRNASRRAENAEKLVALAANAAKESDFLEDHTPRNNRKKEQKQENAAGHPAGLREKTAEVCQKNRREQKNDLPHSENK